MAVTRYLAQPRIEDPIWLEPSDVSFLRTRISEAEAKLQSIDDEISKSAKLVEIASLRNILSLVRRAPPEILSEIFEFVCAHWGFDFIKTMRCALVLAAVCAARRKVALATPRIWSTISLRNDEVCRVVNKEQKDEDDFEPEVAVDVDWVPEWITRSQGPLDVILDCFTAKEYDFAAGLLLDPILQFCHRIRSLDLTGLPPSFLDLYSLPSSSLPLLEKVSLTLAIDDEDFDDEFGGWLTLLPRRSEVFLGALKL
ncbi:hypothetical protein BT96DRAFT_914245 [Gymnopus androsaceus JB14]|uniref:F-box domain-containing protein n=1 Tax=Gymnopus androsaceus JB14 TaxID=1447944 RepID=A0A6A4IGW4_9AGAR|nr:hypothetical protein BT96DRAFT_914245 [Gymnopus androsaceus JB14]